MEREKEKAWKQRKNNPRSKEAIFYLSKVRGSQAFMNYAEAFKVEKILG